jgi:hypothetical protein
MLIKEISLTNYLLIILLFSILIGSIMKTCCTINLNNSLELMNCTSCKLNFDFAVTKNDWLSKIDDNN